MGNSYKKILSNENIGEVGRSVLLIGVNSFGYFVIGSKTLLFNSGVVVLYSRRNNFVVRQIYGHSEALCKYQFVPISIYSAQFPVVLFFVRVI